MKKPLLHTCFIGVLAMVPLLSSAQTVTNLYHTNRVFKPIEFTNMGSSITAYEAYTMIHRLTTVVGPTNIVTNAIWATEYEGLSWCLPSAESAWACVLSKYPYTTKCTSNHIDDNAGWVKGTKSLDGEWGGFLWLQQNSVDFRSSETNIWVSPDGITNRIVKVLVGSIGDYPPMTNVVDVGPTNWANITNCPGAGVSTEAVYRADFTTYYQVINPLLIPDYDHNRVIDGRDRSKAVQNEVFHFWKNDDDDAGDLEGNDIPGDGTADSSDLAVDGTRDLVDWFPVYLDLKPTLEAFDSLGYKYVLATLETNEFNVIFSELKPWESGKYLTDLSNATVSAVVQTINSNGYQLTTAFLDGIENDNKGIILVEGKYNTTQPLHLRILDATNGVVLTKSLPLRISGVEEMYRYLNLRPSAGDTTGGGASHIGEPPNNPNVLNDQKNVVFIHGFNESPDAGRGNIAETFKRLYWSGSKAKFTGVAWRGDMGATHYHASVTNAFATAPDLAWHLIDLHDIQGEEVNVIAFSLGNMVASSALQDWSADVDRYFMLHAAMAREAYDPGQYDSDMRHIYWRDYTNRLYTSKWYQLFPQGDGRNDLSWAGRFTAVVGPQVYNFYSSGEDVLQNLSDGGAGFGALWDIIWGRYQYVWCIQELWKGRYWDFVGGSTYGGWGFTDNHDYYTATTDEYNNVTWTLWDASTANQQGTNMDLKAKPFFDSDAPVLSLLQEPDNPNGAGSQFATANRDRLLSDTIPALSFSTGANHLAPLGNDGNFDMNAMKNGWPSTRMTDWSEGRWLHGDYRAVAYLYVYQVFDTISKELGGFNQ